MTRTGWIIYNGSLPGNKFLDFAMMLQTAAKKQNVPTSILTNNQLLSYLNNKLGDLVMVDQKPLPDFVIFTDKDIYLAKQLELLGVSVFNKADAIEKSDDKIKTYQCLTKNKLPIPKTIIAPKSFSNNHIDDFYQLDTVIKTLGLPLIVKEAFGSFGEQVYLLHSKKELIEKIQSIQGKPFVFQAFIQTSYGKDVRLQVVGKKVVASMKRTSEHDFRANITSGGKMEPYEPSPLEKSLAIHATRAIGADFAGVDLLFGEQGKPIICEVNSNAHIRNIYTCTNINPADFMVAYILQQLKNERDAL